MNSDVTLIVDTPEMRIKRLILGNWSTNTYVVSCSKTGDSVLVDAPADSARIMAGAQGTSLIYILLTHGHEDHTGALADLKRAGIRVAAHQADAILLPCAVDVLLRDGDVINVGKLAFRVFHTPGHTLGSLCFFTAGHLLCGDTIFPGGPGHTQSPSNFRCILTSIKEKILSLPDDIELHPGHGESTNVEEAKREYAVFASREHRPDLCGDVLWSSS